MFLLNQEVCCILRKTHSVQLIEIYYNNGMHESFTNEVIEIAVRKCHARIL